MNALCWLLLRGVFGSSVVCSLPVKAPVCVCLAMQISLPSCPNLTTLPFPTIHQMMSVRIRCSVTTESKRSSTPIHNHFNTWSSDCIPLLSWSMFSHIRMTFCKCSPLNDIFPHMLFLRKFPTYFFFPSGAVSWQLLRCCMFGPTSLPLPLGF